MNASTANSFITNHFTPCPWLRDAHLQTIAGSFWPAPLPRLYVETLELADGDVIDLLRTGAIAERPAVLIMHGLEGSINSPHIRQFLQILHVHGFCGVLLQARGAAARPNRRRRGYHSGDWQDANAAVALLRQQGATSVAAIGISLGGNQLLKWLGESGSDCPLHAAIAISVPFDLAASSAALDTGFARLYQHHLLRLMHRSMLAKRHLLGLSKKTIKKISSIREFDAVLTAPIHGFRDVDDYYRRASCRQYLPGIRRPCLIIHAADDPFIPAGCIPAADELSESTKLQLSVHGGHVGFLSGLRPRPWLPAVIAQWMQQQHSAPAAGADTIAAFK